LIVLDPNPPMLAFASMFRKYRDQVTYVAHGTVRKFDPFARTITTDYEDIRFDDAIALPPQQAGDLVWQAGLIGKEADGKPSGWAAQDPVHLHALDDERIFLIGDLMGKVSPLFGFYPKSGQAASRLGRIAAGEIAARARGLEPVKALPDSVCHIYTDVEPMEALQLDAQYRFRSDGAVLQAGKTVFNPHPQDEDLRWAQGMFREFLA
jgi:hypothetical protein